VIEEDENGEIIPPRQRKDEGNTYYNAEGKRVPGVTTVISKALGFNKESLMFWANRVGREEGKYHRDVSEEAATIGSIAHLGVEADVKNEPFDLNQIDLPAEHKIQLYTALGAWETWKSYTKLELLYSEVKVISEQMQVGGRIDTIARALDKLCLLDLKSGAGVYPEQLCQIAAYGHAWNETHEEQIEGYHILRIDKKTAAFTHRYYPPAALIGTQDENGEWTYAPPLEAFTHARRLYEIWRQMKKLVG
jgi:hypothetical protein